MSLVRVNLFYMSICGGILALTVLLIRLLLKNRLPKRTFSILWGVALLRLLIPFSVGSSFSVFSVIQDRIAVLQNHGTGGGDEYRAVFPTDFFSEGLYFGEAFGYDQGIGGFPDGGYIADMEENHAGSPMDSGFRQGVRGLSLLREIGMAGTVVCAAVFLMLYLNCLKRFRTALPVKDPSVEQWLERSRLRRKVKVCQSDRISSPLTYGLIRPVILLPKRLERGEGQELKYILQHELVHIRRMDGAWKFVMVTALCLHWFNPLVWVMYVFMNRDLELSCDEEVLRIFGTEARKGYALTLIGMEERRYLPAFYSGFGKNAVEERVGEIMKYKKKTKIAMCAGAALILAVVCMFATISRAEEDPSGTDKGLSDGRADAAILMDPPAGYLGDMTGMDSGSGSGASAGTDSDTDAGTVGAAGQSAGSIKEPPENGESDYRLIYMKEGLPESEPARLAAGQGFYILLPEEGWTAFGPDGWMSETNNEVELWAAHFSSENSDYRGYDREQIAAALQREGYQEEDGRYWMYEEAEDRMTVVELRQTGEQDFWGVFYTYPGEAEDGWGVELRAMAQTFSTVSPELSETRQEEETPGADLELARRLQEVYEAQIARQLIISLVQAVGEKDHDSILPYIAEGYEVDLDCLDRITEWKSEEVQVRIHPGGDSCIASIQVTTDESDADSRDYLTIQMAKEEGVWKISFMGLEK